MASTDISDRSGASNVVVRLDHPVDSRRDVKEPFAGVGATNAEAYYQTHHHVTRQEYHVVPSTATPGRYWVRNVLDLTVCVHDDAVAAGACARGAYCSRGGPGGR